MIRKSVVLLAFPLALASCDNAEPSPTPAGTPAETSPQIVSTDVPSDAELSLSDFEISLPTLAGRPAALYGTITGGAQDDTLTAIAIDGVEVELHRTMEMDGGAMRMMEHSEIPVPAGETVVLQSGGWHGMIFGKLEQGAVPVTLTFANAGTRTVDAVADYHDGADE